MRTCPRCGTTYGSDVAFCFKDGVPLKEQEPQPTLEPVDDPDSVDVREDATDAPSLSSLDIALPETSVDAPPALPEVATEDGLPAATTTDMPMVTQQGEDPGPERIDEPQELVQKDAPVPTEPVSDEPSESDAFFEAAPVVEPAEGDDEPLEPAGRSNGLLIGMGLAAAAMLGVGGWLLWQSMGSGPAPVETEPPRVEAAVMEATPEPVVTPEPEPVVEEPAVEEPPVEEPVDEEPEPVVEEPVPVEPEPVEEPPKTTTPKKTTPTQSKPKTTEPKQIGNTGATAAKKKGAVEDPWGEADEPTATAPEKKSEPEKTQPQSTSKTKVATKKETDENPWGEVED